VARLAFEGLSANEIGRARISMMARSDLLHARGRIQKRKTRYCTLQIQLATLGRSIQSGQLRKQLPLTLQSLPRIVNYADAAWNGVPFV
jgi:hypothetical protein